MRLPLRTPAILAFSALLLGSVVAHGQEKPAGETVLPSVTSTAVRDPVEKSYRRMIGGMDLFERMHAMAPNATLRYKLLPRRPETNMSNVSVDIIGKTVALPVRVARDHTFTLERDPKAMAEDASVIPNRKSGSMTWRTEIRTPGLPPDTRRLGDLRLECLVGMEAGLVSNGRPLFGKIANMLLGAMDYCNQDDTEYLFFAERPVFSVTLVSGARKETLSVDRMYAGATYDTGLKDDLPYCDCQVLVDRTYFLPLGDRSWPDDTLVQFEYMDDDNGPPPSKADITG